jgi:Ca2+-binding RTX toxin-like protein
VTTDFTIAAGEVYSGTTGAVFYMPNYPPNWVFRNYGTIHASGRDVIGFLGGTVRGEFLNAGLIRVDSTGGASYCVEFESWGPTFINTGRIELNGPGQAFRSWSVNQRLENYGTIIATDLEGGGDALWFRNCAELINHGQIIAEGPAAVAVFINNFHYSFQTGPTTFIPSFFENNGDVIARGQGGGPTYALMLDGDFPNNRPTTPNIINNGLIQADRAIWWVGEVGAQAVESMEWVLNHGEMYGDVNLGISDDTFVSDGVYVGRLDMGEGDDLVDLTLNSGRAIVDLGGGADVAYGSVSADQIVGSAGDDQIHGGEGADMLEGVEDNDQIFGGSGNDRIVGGWHQDVLWGDAGNDVLIGDEVQRPWYSRVNWNNNDQLFGGAGDDILTGGLDNDYIDGGDGFDTATFSRLRSQYTITHQDGVVLVQGPDYTDTLVNVERLDFFDGYYTPDGVLISRHQSELSGEISGTVDGDTLRGGSGDDVITPHGGYDLIDGGGGNDVVWLQGRLDEYKIIQIGDDFLLARWYAEPKYLTQVETVRFAGGGVLELNRIYGTAAENPLVLPAEAGSESKGADPVVLPDVEVSLGRLNLPGPPESDFMLTMPDDGRLPDGWF